MKRCRQLLLLLQISFFLGITYCFDSRTPLSSNRVKQKKASIAVARSCRGGNSIAKLHSNTRAAQSVTRRTYSRQLFSAWLYYLACSLTIPAIPKLVNHLIGDGEVTSKSVSVYGLLVSFDAFFTFMTTNFHATLSDTFGRKPFFILSSLGLGVGFLLTMFAKSLWVLLLAASIDGCTSCMYSIAQSSIADVVGKGSNLSESLAHFQGLSIGMAFTFGMPIGGILASKKGYRFNLGISAAICLLNVFLCTAFLPETLSNENRKEKADFLAANPFGAFRFLFRNSFSSGITLTKSLLWISTVGLQVNFLNYTDKKFKWSPGQSGVGLAMMGVMIAVAPKLILPVFGLRKSLVVCLILHGIGQLLIGAAPIEMSTTLVYCGLLLSSVGSVAFPTCISLLAEQAKRDETGVIQGAADTVKTAVTVVSNPLMAACFGYFISEMAPKGMIGGSYYVGGAVSFAAALVALLTISFGRTERRHDVAE